MERHYQAVMMKPLDHVAVTLMDIPADVEVIVSCHDQLITVKLKDPIAFGHKFAVKPIPHGEDVRKYGEIIGVAIRDISIGEHVHIHNLEGKRGRGDRNAR